MTFAVRAAMRILCVLCSLFLLAAAPEDAVRTTTLHGIVTQAHANATFDGVVVVSRNGKVVFSEAVGVADRARGIPMHENTVFRLASQTKQITALLIMQEVAAGRLTLNSHANEILRGLSPATGRVTVLQLLQHVSGLPNPSDGPDDVVPPFYLRTGRDAASNTKSALGFCSGLAKRDPGATFEYNNCDYIVLGALLEAITGRSYANLVRERVILPLKLTSWGVFDGSQTAPDVAVGYGADAAVELPQNVATYGAAGALYGNALDVATWDQALLDYRLLSKAATERMFTADPHLYGEALGSWAYDVNDESGAVRVVERQGEIGGTRLLNILLPGISTSVVIIANTERADLFNTYGKRGFGYDILKVAASLK